MGRKDVLAAWSMWGGAANLAGDTTSNVTTVQYMDNIGIIVTWTGTSPLGTLFIDVSNDNFQTFESLDFGASVDITGNTGSHQININQLPYGYIRARYARTSGSGSLVAVLSSKQLGG